MTASLLDDAMAHHLWATEVLIDACAELPPGPTTAARSVPRSPAWAPEPPEIDLWAYGEATGRTRPEYA